MGLGELAFCVAALAVGEHLAGYDINRLRTLAFVIIVFGNQATTYNNRERQRIWSSRPSWWLAASSCVDILIAAMLAVSGIAMAPLPLFAVAATFVAAAAFALVMDFVKFPVFRRLAIG
jgi:H+-transporting ATPase